MVFIVNFGLNSTSYYVLVAHKEFKALSSAEVRSLFVTCPEEETPLLFDVKSIYDPKEIRGEGLAYWNL